MKKHFIKLHSTPTRYLLSDVLPYELPASISNRGIYKFIEKYKICFRFGDKGVEYVIRSGKDKEVENTINTIIELLFLLPASCTKSYKPYIFKTRIRDDKKRTMSVIHPSSQIAAMVFMERFKEQVLYQCSISHFSIRTPSRIASVRYFYDYSHGLVSIGANEKISRIEEIGKEYETVRSYFSYTKFSNIYRFYESCMHHRFEKKFNYMSQVDISSCFESIYTHSISWAIYGKEMAKAYRAKGSDDMCFPDMFDMLMRNSNYAETNGIPIGPEISRIFAEIILQRIDFDLERKLSADNYSVIPTDKETSYQICRYVDDYFIFYNNPDDYKRIKRYLSECLAAYNLKLNEAKENKDQKLPSITAISIAKNRISTFFKELEKQCGWEKDEKGIKHFRFPNYSSEEAIIKYKTIITGIEESRLSNFLLTNFEIFMQSIIDKWLKGCKEAIKGQDVLEDKEMAELFKSSKRMTVFFQNVINVLFFILSSEQPVNSFIIVSRILVLILRTLRISRDLRSEENNTEQSLAIPSAEVYREIIHKIKQYIKKDKDEDFPKVEQLMLINVAAELEGRFYLDESLLLTIIEKGPDYMTIVVVMRYIRNIKRYNKIHTKLIEQITCLLNKKYSSLSTDQTMLAFDMISCPYIETKDKFAILDQYINLGFFSSICNALEMKDKQEIIKFIEENRISFTNWAESSLAYELEFKRAEFVY